MRVIGELLNFTVQHHHHTIKELGTAPIEFPANASGKWGGLFGEVFAAKYQMSTTYWNNRYVGKLKPNSYMFWIQMFKIS